MILRNAARFDNIARQGYRAGRSSRNRPVSTMIWERLGLTFLVSFVTLIFVWIIALPIGIYSAVRQYSYNFV